LDLNYPDFDIVVVDNRPDPNRPPLPIFQGDGRVHACWEPHRGVSAARNAGIARATGEFVAFTDDDAVVDGDWLREIGARFAACPGVDGVSGLVLPLELRTEPQLWFEEFFGGFNQSFSAELMSMELLADDPLFPYSTGRFGAGCNMAIRRSALIARGGFDVTLGVGTPSRGGEDLAMFMKLVLTGGTLAFEPRAVVRHQHRETEEDFFSQVFGYGTGLTAMFTALILHDPRHIIQMIGRAPEGLRLLTRPRDERSPSEHASYPRRTYAYHLLGLAYGPIAYARSVARERWGS
jgi:cellulose synthase/poly-beta-1,6-N-acetylglucosamine synthase-like glycosyltransferase